MTVLYIDGACGSPRFDQSLQLARDDPSIVSLVFVSAQICDAAADQIVQLLCLGGDKQRNWQSILLSNCSGDGVDTVIAAALQVVHDFEIRGAKGVTPEHSLAIQQGLQRTATLTKLCFSITSSLDEESCRLISEGLRDNRSLTALHFSCCKVFPPVTSSFIDLLSSGKETIQSLRLDSCRLEDCQLRDVFETLQTFQNLQHLSFPYNRCESLGYQALAQLLQSPTCRIQELDCSRQHVNTIHGEYLDGVFDSIPSSLTRLNLSYCPLNDQQMKKIASFLLNTQSLNELYLCGCKLSEEALLSLTSILPRLHSLRTLWLTGSQCFTETGIDQLVHCGLRHNTSLYEVLLPQWLVSRDMTKQIAMYVDLNRAGRRLICTTTTTTTTTQPKEEACSASSEVVVPPGLWPMVLQRIQQTCRFSQQEEHPSLAQSNATYYLLREKILLESSSSAS